MSRYMTQTGADRINAEIDHLWRVERPEIVIQVRAAAEQGDRSENAAYIYGKKRLREIDSRLRYLRNKLKDVTLLDVSEQIQFDDVRFGAVVTVVDDDEKEKTWRLVDKDESDPKGMRISVQSPIGRALLGKTVGDYVEIQLPRGRTGLEITGLRYGSGEPE
jgi:transcription elongation factor GreB